MYPLFYIKEAMQLIDEVLLEKNIPCTMRDGTVLYADVYRPNTDEKYPVLLTRLPYNKDSPFYSHRYLDTNRLVRNGYVVIIQDVRGRFNSEGEFYPMKYEAEDGYDTVEWAAKLPYSTGEVGMFGMSYYGYTQLLAAKEQPPSLQAIFPTMTLNGRSSEGPFLLASSESLALESFAPDLLKRKYKNDPETYNEMMKNFITYYNNIEEWYDYAPVKEWPPLKELGVTDFFFEMLNGTESDEPSAISIFDKYDQIEVPAYHIAGWYDNLLEPTIENYNELTKQAPNEKARNNQKLLIGPWSHGFFDSVIGERFFGIHASEDWIDQKEDLTDLHLRWFDHWLKGKDTLPENEAPIKIFVMGINEWRDEHEWPLARTTYEPLYLHSEGKANTRFGNGKLSFEKPENQPTDEYVYDPKNPVPTHGGGTLFSGANAAGPLDQQKIQEREDVLVYTSERLNEPLEVTGPIKVKLWARTDAPSTDFTAKLIDVQPDGTAYNLTDGIIRTKPNNQNEVTEYEINLWPTSNVFLPEHKIRLEISSSNYPRYDANLNTGKTMLDSKDSVKANQAIYHQEEFASQIILPIIK